MSGGGEQAANFEEPNSEENAESEEQTSAVEMEEQAPATQAPAQNLEENEPEASIQETGQPSDKTPPIKVTTRQLGAVPRDRKGSFEGSDYGGRKTHRSNGSRRSSVCGLSHEEIGAIEDMGVDTALFAGLNLSAPDRRSRRKSIEPSDWLAAATVVHDIKFGHQFDSVGMSVAQYRELRRVNCGRFFWVSMFGLFTAVWSNECYYQAGRHHSFQSLCLEFTTMVMTGISIFFLVWFYHAELCILRLKGWKISPGFSMKALKGGNLYTRFWRDVIILIPQPLPIISALTFSVYDASLGRKSEYSFSVVLLSLMFVRVFFLPRFHSHCIRDLNTEEHDVFFSLNKAVLDDAFMLKSAMTTSLSAVTALFVLLIVVYAYMLMMFERSTAEGPLKNWANSIWLIVVTMTTVGYGDIYPTTRLGRVIALAASFSALVMVAIITNLVRSLVVLSRSEQQVTSVALRHQKIRGMSDSASRLITATFKLHIAKKRSVQAAADATREEAERLETSRMNSEVRVQEAKRKAVKSVTSTPRDLLGKSDEHTPRSDSNVATISCALINEVRSNLVSPPDVCSQVEHQKHNASSLF